MTRAPTGNTSRPAPAATPPDATSPDTGSPAAPSSSARIASITAIAAVPATIKTPMTITEALSQRMNLVTLPVMTRTMTPATTNNPGAARHHVRIGDAEAGRRLDRVLADALPELSRTRVKALIEQGRVSRLDAASEPGGEPGAATIDEPSRRVKSGQTFAVIVPDAEPPRPLPQDIALRVIHEDDDLLVIDKPAGLVVHPAPGNPDGTLVNALIAHCGDGLSGIGGVRRPGIVHRLDKETSGLMVVAKNDRAHAGLAAQFEARAIERAYHAVVWGAPAAASGTIEGNIGRSPRNRKKMAVVARGGKPALTRWRLVRRIGNPVSHGATGRSSVATPVASILECRLATGRTHQIRVHLAHRGMAVIGDRAYGGRLTPARRRAIGEDARAAVSALTRHALDAYSIGFVHPVSGEMHRYSHDGPKELKELIDLLDRI